MSAAIGCCLDSASLIGCLRAYVAVMFLYTVSISQHVERVFSVELRGRHTGDHSRSSDLVNETVLQHLHEFAASKRSKSLLLLQ